MKRNISLLVLACEILAIVTLHAMKINQGSKSTALNNTAKETTTLTRSVHPYQLVSLK